jgi:hypothetical protein
MAKPSKGQQCTINMMELQPYNFSILYRAGAVNGNTDGLSRAFAADPATLLPEKEGGV